MVYLKVATSGWQFYILMNQWIVFVSEESGDELSKPSPDVSFHDGKFWKSKYIELA